MAAAPKMTAYNWFVGVAVTATTLMAGAIFVQLLSQAERLGEHGARLQNIEKASESTAADVVSLQKTIGEEFLKLNNSLAYIKSTMDRSAADPNVMIANMGLAEPGDVFGAVIYKDALWAFPASETMAKRLRDSGLQREQVNSALYGFKVMKVSAPDP